MATLLLAPLPMEQAQLSHNLKQQWRHERIRKDSREIDFFPDQNVYLGVGGHGKVEMALATQFWITKLSEITQMACVGCAGSLHESVAVGDIVVATQTIEHDYRQLFFQKPLPAFLMAPIWKDHLQKFPPPIKWGVIASGDEDVLSLQRRQEVYTQTQALAVAWEGAGAARACTFLNIPFCEIRGITDDSQTQIKQDFTKNLNQVMLKIANGLAIIF